MAQHLLQELVQRQWSRALEKYHEQGKTNSLSNSLWLRTYPTPPQNDSVTVGGKVIFLQEPPISIIKIYLAFKIYLQ